MVNHCEGHKISQNIEHQLQESILYHYLKRSFFLKKKTFIKLRCMFNPIKTIYWQLLRHGPSIQIIYASVLKIWWFFIFMIIFMYLLLAFVYQWIVLHILPHFSTISNVPTSANKSSFILVFLRATCHAHPGVVRKRAGSSLYILQDG